MTHAEMAPLLEAVNQHQLEREELVDLIEQFADHGSWKCDDPDRWHDDGTACPCGLTDALDRVGIDPAPWSPAARVRTP